MKTTIKLAGFYAIGNQEIECSAKADRNGITVSAENPAAGMNECLADKNIQQKRLTWDEVEANDDAVRFTAVELARKLQELNGCK